MVKFCSSDLFLIEDQFVVLLSLLSVKGRVSSLAPRQKCTGVSISEPFWSSEIGHIGREFNTNSIMQNRVVNSSQDKALFPISF